MRQPRDTSHRHQRLPHQGQQARQGREKGTSAMMNTEHQTPPPVHGTPAWWKLWGDYRQGLGRAAWLIDRMRSDEMVHGKGLERDEGYEQAMAMLDEAASAIQKARDARHQINELGKARDEAA